METKRGERKERYPARIRKLLMLREQTSQDAKERFQEESEKVKTHILELHFTGEKIY